MGETARLQGFFSQLGLDSGAQSGLMRFAAGASQRGAIEMGSVTNEALASITARIATAQAQLGQGATSAQRQETAINTFRQAFAELQVEASSGISARQGGNALRNASALLVGSQAQGRVLNNIRQSRDITADQRSRLQAALFEADPAHRGRQRLRSTNVLDVMTAFQGVMGNNSTAFSNIFAGGGHGNAMSLLSNQRGALGAMLNVDTDNRSGLDRIRELLGSGVSLTDADMNRGANIFGNDTQAQLNKNEERRLNALTDNTNVIVQLSDSFAQFTASNPLLNAIGGGALMGGARSLGGTILGGARGLLGRVGGGIAARLGAAGLTGTAATLGTSVGAASAGAIAGTVGVGLAVGGGVGEGISRYGVQRAMIGTNANGTAQDTRVESVFSRETLNEFAKIIGEQISRISLPHATTQAANEARFTAAASMGRT